MKLKSSTLHIDETFVRRSEYGGELEYLRTYVRHLRKTIEEDPARPEYILTEPWLGYRSRDPADSDAPLFSASEPGP